MGDIEQYFNDGIVYEWAEMEYSINCCEPVALVRGRYHDFDYYVVSFGTYPCAYVD